MGNEKVTFIAYQPFLTVGYATILGDPKYISNFAGRAIQFDAEAKYTTDNPIEIQRIREFIKRTESQHMITELVDGLDPLEFTKLHQEAEDAYNKKVEKEAEEKRLESAQNETSKDRKKEELFRLLSNGSY